MPTIPTIVSQQEGCQPSMVVFREIRNHCEDWGRRWSGGTPESVPWGLLFRRCTAMDYKDCGSVRDGPIGCVFGISKASFIDRVDDIRRLARVVTGARRFRRRASLQCAGDGFRR